ncbi:MAG: hypothetical protein WA642_02790 [Steroidobacteraceae bacterium]
MDELRKPKIRRRDMLIAATASGIAAAVGAGSIPSAKVAAKRDKRKAQYQADSPEIQTFYRVNRYPAKT